MRLADLCGALEALGFPRRDERAHPGIDTVRSARAEVTRAVADDELLADCLRAELALIECDEQPRGLVPFHTIEGPGIGLAFGYWSPGGGVAPHEHTAWTVTAVCRNELEVVTFDRHETYRNRALVPKKSFRAPAGMVGFIFDPAIHAPRNASAEWSLSLHLMSPRDGEPLFDYPTLPALCPALDPSSAERGGAHARVALTCQRERLVRGVVRVLATMPTEDVGPLFADCFRIASFTATRRWIQRIAPSRSQAAALASPWVLARTDPGLALVHRVRDGVSSLMVETSSGPRAELVVTGVREAIELAAQERAFDVRALPGNLDDDTQHALGDALEATGLFRRVW